MDTIPNDFDVPPWVDTIIQLALQSSPGLAVDSHPYGTLSSPRNQSRNTSDAHSSMNIIGSSAPINVPSSPQLRRRGFTSPRAVPRLPTLSELLTNAASTTGLDRVRLALTIIRAPDAPPLNEMAADKAIPRSLVLMLHGSSSAAFAEPNDRAAVIVAAHTLCNYRVFQANFLAVGGLTALCTILRPALQDSVPGTADRITSRSGVFAVAEKKSSAAHRPMPSSDSDSTTLSVAPAVESSSSTSLPASPSASVSVHGGIHLLVWNAAIRTVAKLMVVSHAACSKSIDTGSLALLAKAARPGEPMDIRLRSAAGLAAIAAWSGPRRAVDIVQTDDVVLSMTSILEEHDERIPNDLRTATIDGLVVMSFRRHARGILQRYGCEEKIKAAARFATVSGDYTAAARSTVAAGQLTGRSIDEYGFLVDEKPENSEGPDSAPETSGDFYVDSQLTRRPTGLEQIQQQLLDEPYTSVEDLNVLEEIVHEDAGVLGSSPRDRNYVRHAARTYGVSADEIEFISLLEDEVSLPKNDTNQINTMSNEQPISERITSSLQGSVENGNLAISVNEKVEIQENSGKSSPDRLSSSSPRTSSHLFPMPDPDFDSILKRDNDDNEEMMSLATGGISKSKMISPLLLFSSATRRAAERDQKPGYLKKTQSQLSRETANERRWKSVLDKHPELLKRERGRSSRVAGYRELASIPVPPSLRRQLWPILLDSASLKEAKPGLYHNLCHELEDKSLADDIEHTIEADVTRTMPLHSLFWAGGAQVGVQSLRSILRAYAHYEPEVGYCQGMSSIAAVFLMNADDEEGAFLMMVQFMSRFQYKKVFAPGFPLMLQWIEELKPLVAHYMPQLHNHLQRENVGLELYADKWLITALSHNFPHRHLLRVWDLMFLGGSPKIVLKACLMVLKTCEARLLTMDFEHILSLLQREFADPDIGVLDAKNPEPFINEMREFRFMADIKKTNNSNSTKLATGSSNVNAAKSSKALRKARRCGCFGCFGRSATIE